jgi:disulfide oxidoreductase YuzD
MSIYNEYKEELVNARHQADYTPLIEFNKEIIKEQYIEVKEAYNVLKLVARDILD